MSKEQRAKKKKRTARKIALAKRFVVRNLNPIVETHRVRLSPVARIKQPKPPTHLPRRCGEDEIHTELGVGYFLY